MIKIDMVEIKENASLIRKEQKNINVPRKKIMY
jgi:hypothetical protein